MPILTAVLYALLGLLIPDRILTTGGNQTRGKIVPLKVWTVPYVQVQANPISQQRQTCNQCWKIYQCPNAGDENDRPSQRLVHSSIILGLRSQIFLRLAAEPQDSFISIELSTSSPHQRPKHRSAVLGDGDGQTKRNKSNREARNHGGNHQHKRLCNRTGTSQGPCTRRVGSGFIGLFLVRAHGLIAWRTRVGRLQRVRSCSR
jgi:hypothetical protein